MEKHRVIYKGETIEFELQRKNVKNINLNTRPDLKVMVSANNNVPLDYIKDFVREKAPWVLKNLKQFKDTQAENPNQKDYVSGETFKYLGKQLRLRVEIAHEERVKYIRGFLYLYIKNNDNYKQKKQLVNVWFRERAEGIFLESLDKMSILVERYNIKRPNILIRTMKARWGSCIKDKGVIILNFELIKAPKYCIDYVILHELLHFKFRNHDGNFYELMTVLMPDWKERKRILDEEIVRTL